MSGHIYGYRISGSICGRTFDEFVLDEGMLDRLRILDVDRHILEMAIIYAANHGSTSFTNDPFSVEVITSACDAPRFVMLRGPQGNRFYSRYDAEDRWNVRKLATGKVVYDILGFADTTAEVQRKLYRATHPLFPSTTRLEISEYRDLHIANCTKEKCDYGNKWCPVRIEK